MLHDDSARQRTPQATALATLDIEIKKARRSSPGNIQQPSDEKSRSRKPREQVFLTVFLIHDGVPSVIAAGYKFGVSHEAISTLLIGTGNVAHLWCWSFAQHNSTD